LLIRRIASADNVEADRVACLIACGYAWKRGGGSHAGEVRGGGRGEDFVDFGLGLLAFGGLVGTFVGVLVGPFFSFIDFDLRFIRDILAVGLGVVGVVSDVTVVVLFMERLRGRLRSATALIDLSEKAETGGVSS
jgi:prepilin signal peptidase PulO-like enzyme (type II secretory pathway)